MTDDNVRRAADLLDSCTAILVSAGAGIGVDSGLPDFRGTEGFWQAYPPFRELGLSFSHLANPKWFGSDPELAWGFYGHRLGLYRDTVPHRGFQILRELSKGRSSFVFTSNVDGQFQKAGWDPSKVLECHGSIHTMQCWEPCDDALWSADDFVPEVDASTFKLVGAAPTCPWCRGIARPNILMFGDWKFNGYAVERQMAAYQTWCTGVDAERLVVIEIGAGTAVPSCRYQSENLMRRGASLIRINPRESHGPAGTVGLPMGGLAGLTAIEALLAS